MPRTLTKSWTLIIIFYNVFLFEKLYTVYCVNIKNIILLSEVWWSKSIKLHKTEIIQYENYFKRDFGNVLICLLSCIFKDPDLLI